MRGHTEKDRLDNLLVRRKLVETRNRARTEIMAGNVLVDGNVKDKPGFLVPVSAEIQLKKPLHPFVSRGGLKLEKALQEFRVELVGKTVLDIGASTGGFTDCALKHGASLVYAVDVGFGQLAWELRNHPRVINLERLNARDLKREHLDRNPDLALIDVSFISLRRILPAVADFPVEEVICLVKPQFEAQKAQVGKKGVVKNAAVHRELLLKITAAAAHLHYRCLGLTYSPVQGPRGNIEFFVHLRYDQMKDRFLGQEELEPWIRTVVEEAHLFFTKKEKTTPLL